MRKPVLLSSSSAGTMYTTVSLSASSGEPGAWGMALPARSSKATLAAVIVAGSIDFAKVTIGFTIGGTLRSLLGG
jgi:hypothetical protein